MTSLRPGVAMVSSAAVLLLLMAFMILPLYRLSRDRVAEIAVIEQSITTLQGRINELASLRKIGTFPRAMLWERDRVSEAEVALQNRVVEFAQHQGLNLITFGVAPKWMETHQEHIAIELEAEGPLTGVYDFLAQLERTTPPIAVHNIRLRKGNSYGYDDGAPGRMNVYLQITVWSFGAASQ
ncbi:type II secretion system protein GspM [Tritonibacter sp. SIMBA_163]|uniref:type II secretion system protein GspM n=1 Tax=Tritonibacter sp. SIMBA_163 TaxID=3080868 RepID=UPI0039802981